MPNGEETAYTETIPHPGAYTWAESGKNLVTDLKIERDELEDAMSKMGLNQSIGSFIGTALGMVLFPQAAPFLKPLIAAGSTYLGGRIGRELTPDKVERIFDEGYGTFYGEEREDFGDILKADLWKGSLKTGTDKALSMMAQGAFDQFNKEGGLKGIFEKLKLDKLRGREDEWDAMQNLQETERISNLFPDTSLEDNLWDKLSSIPGGIVDKGRDLVSMIGSPFHKEQVGYDVLGNRVTQKLDISGNVIPDSTLTTDIGFDARGPETTDIGFNARGPETTDIGFDSPTTDVDFTDMDALYDDDAATFDRLSNMDVDYIEQYGTPISDAQAKEDIRFMADANASEGRILDTPETLDSNMFNIQSQLVSDLIGSTPAAAGLTGGDSVNLINIASMIDPANANPAIVGQFQQAVMGMSPGDPGYGMFGPETTLVWQHIMGYGR